LERALVKRDSQLRLHRPAKNSFAMRAKHTSVARKQPLYGTALAMHERRAGGGVDGDQHPINHRNHGLTLITPIARI